MRSGLASMIGCMVVLILAAGPAHSACCDWPDRKACSTCPTGYISGCRTQGNGCQCSCGKDSGELIKNLAEGNESLRAYLRDNLDTIMKEAHQGKPFQAPGGIRINVAPAQPLEMDRQPESEGFGK